MGQEMWGISINILMEMKAIWTMNFMGPILTA